MTQWAMQGSKYTSSALQNPYAVERFVASSIVTSFRDLHDQPRSMSRCLGTVAHNVTV